MLSITKRMVKREEGRRRSIQFVAVIIGTANEDVDHLGVRASAMSLNMVAIFFPG